MLPDINAELTPDQISQLQDARKLIPKLREQIRRAKLAGIDMTTQEADLSTIETNLDKLYRVYVSRITTTGRP